jgi:hypothetical protein
MRSVGGGGYWFYRDYAQRNAEQGRVTADKEAKLAAELQAAKDVLAQAEAGKQRADSDKAAAETAQREAKLQSKLRAAKDALQKAGVLTATWTYRLLQAKGHATGTITADGHVNFLLDAFNPDGSPLKGAWTGSWASNVITLSGSLDDGTTGNATLTWAPDRPAAAAAASAINRADCPRRAQKSKSH